MHGTFHSFFQGGFECSTMRMPDGRRRDLVESTGHARHAARDFQALAELGIRTVRDGVRWHLIEQQPRAYDWSSFLPQLDAATRSGTQVIWDLCHYGWPDHLDIWAPCFPQAFARFAGKVAAMVRDHSPQPPLYCPINEISFWAWGGGEMGYIGPCAMGRGDELKRQLARASLAAMEVIRLVDARARFILADPMIRVAPLTPADSELAAGHNTAQYQGWDMIAGMACPELGGGPRYLDIIGVNFYPHNQWFLDGPTIARGDPHYTPMRDLLARVYNRYRRPILIAETGAEGGRRAGWLSYVCDEVAAAIEMGIPIEGICLYPVTDYPGWDDDRHCPTGLLGFPDELGHRAIDLATAAELAAQQRRFANLLQSSADSRLAAVR
jgi:beta-glucosidase/6-phospho-beta-glucosidase/beta-galactosidase